VFGKTGQSLRVVPGIGGGARGIFVGKIPFSEKVGPDWQIPSKPKWSEPMLVVANTSGRNLLVFDTKGRKVGAWGTRGSGNAKLEEPVDAEATPFGLAVADSKRPRVVFYDGRGRYLRTWKIPTPPSGDYTNEIHLKWDRNREWLFATDPEHDRLWAFDGNGKVVLEKEVKGKPTGIEVGSNGKVYVTSRLQSRVIAVPLGSRAGVSPPLPGKSGGPRAREVE